MGKHRFQTFTLSHKESDIWFGLSRECNLQEIKNFAYRKLIVLREIFDKYIEMHPNFFSSQKPVQFDHTAPAIIKNMQEAAKKAETGPMAAIAGAFAQYIGESITNEFHPKELILENGGDDYIVIEKELISSIYAGSSPLSNKIGLKIPATFSPLGICTSAGSFGSSHSLGRADAVVIAAKNTMVADAYATALCNKIQSTADIDKVIKFVEGKPEILASVFIKDDKIAVSGKLEIEILK